MAQGILKRLEKEGVVKPKRTIGRSVDCITFTVSGIFTVLLLGDRNPLLQLRVCQLKSSKSISRTQ